VWNRAVFPQQATERGTYPQFSTMCSLHNTYYRKYDRAALPQPARHQRSSSSRETPARTTASHDAFPPRTPARHRLSSTASDPYRASIRGSDHRASIRGSDHIGSPVGDPADHHPSLAKFGFLLIADRYSAVHLPSDPAIDDPFTVRNAARWTSHRRVTVDTDMRLTSWQIRHRWQCHRSQKKRPPESSSGGLRAQFWAESNQARAESSLTA